MLWLVCAWPTDPSGKQRPTTRPGILLCCASTSKTLFTNESKLLQWLADSLAKTKFNWSILYLKL